MKSISVLCQETDPQKITLSKFQKYYFALSNEVKTVAQNVVQSRVARQHCYKKKAASIGQNGRLSACCNFFSSWLIRPRVGMWYPDTWISGYLDIQAFLAIHYPDTKKVEISKYPSIQVSMISKYPCIQVSGYLKNRDIQLSMYPNIG